MNKSLKAKLIGRPIQAIYDHFYVIPSAVQEENYWFYSISNLAYNLILLLHVTWIFVFHSIHQPFMMYIQFASIATYGVAVMLNRKGWLVAAMTIALLEANLHQLTAVAMLGWSSGFQNFIPLIALMPFLKYNSSWFVKCSLGIGSLLCYLFIDMTYKNALPAATLDKMEMAFFNLTNAVLCFVLVALWGIVLSVSYKRTVDALIRKEQELFASEKEKEQTEIRRQLEMTERDNEIFQLRNVELRSRNNEITLQKKQIEELVTEQDKIIAQRTKELADANHKLIIANAKLIELIQYNAHNLREPLARIMGAMLVAEYVPHEEFQADLLPLMDKAVKDLDASIRDVIHIADETIKSYA